MDVAEALRRLDEVVARRTAHCGEWATSAITAALWDWAAVLGASVELEAPCRYVLKGREVAGYVDAVLTFPSGWRLAVEVDRTHKPQSLAKLEAMRQAGCRVLWLRWNEANRTESTAVLGVRVHWLRIARPVALDAYKARDAKRRAARARKRD